LACSQRQPKCFILGINDWSIIHTSMRWYQEWALDIVTASPGHFDCGDNDTLFFTVSKQAMFASMGIKSANGELRLPPTDALESGSSQFNDVKNSFLSK
jgi:hypothetical protein